MVSFHQESQRYAVGTLSSVIVIFDLRTATKWRMLEGHKKALTAVAFVASGDMVASYSAEEKALKLWRSGSKGFMSQMLSVTSRCQNTIALRPIRDVEKITAEKMLKTVKLNWISPRVVHLIREDGSSVTEQLK
jgi:WD40 repeat protein